MIKTQIKQVQVNLKNKAGYCVCPYANIIKKRPVLGCKLACDKYAGIEGGFVLCGQHGANKDVLVDKSNPRVHQIMNTYGDNLDYVCGVYGKPVGLKGY